MFWERYFPSLSRKPHLVLIHDTSDNRYGLPHVMDHGDNGIWKGTDFSGPRLKLAIVDSAVEQSIAILDFSTRNRLQLH